MVKNLTLIQRWVVKTARCGCAAGGCSCVAIGDPVSAGCTDTVVTGTGSLTDPFTISSSVIIDPNACNLTDCGEAGLITLLNTMDSACIDFSGCGTVASPLTASPIFDPATDDCLNCGPNGFRLVIDPVAGNQLSCGVSGLFVTPAVSGGGGGPISAVAVDTSCIDMTVTGDGTLGSPLTISAIPVVDPVTGNQLSCGVNGLLVTSGGTLNYAQIVANQEGITTEVDVTGLVVPVTVGAGRRIKISAFINASKTVADGEKHVYIKEGATYLQVIYEAAGSVGIDTLYGSVILTPSAGPHTYKLAADRSGTGTMSLIASATAPAFILVEDIGAA